MPLRVCREALRRVRLRGPTGAGQHDMDIEAQIESERGQPVLLLSDPRGYVNWLLSFAPLDGTMCLKFIDPYGNTIFNRSKLRIMPLCHSPMMSPRPSLSQAGRATSSTLESAGCYGRRLGPMRTAPCRCQDGNFCSWLTRPRSGQPIAMRRDCRPASAGIVRFGQIASADACRPRRHRFRCARPETPPPLSRQTRQYIFGGGS
jgi:hypothetical protein